MVCPFVVAAISRSPINDTGSIKHAANAALLLQSLTKKTTREGKEEEDQNEAATIKKVCETKNNNISTRRWQEKVKRFSSFRR